MKKLYFIAALALSTLTVSAQQKLQLSTYQGTNIEKYAGKTMDVIMNRTVHTGWNTVALPFDMSEEELNNAFGQDCKLERMVGAEENGGVITLSFQDCKAGGIKANTPYILHYTGQLASKRIQKTTALKNATAKITCQVPNTDIVVTMQGAQKFTPAQGRYGILVRDNAEAQFTNVDALNTGFFATSCFIMLSNGTQNSLITRHLDANETTGIAAIANADDIVNVYSVGGALIAKNVKAAQVNNLRPGIYVVNGRQVAVK